MVKRRRYTDEFRASAVLMLEAAGYPQTEGALSRVADHLGMHYQTLSRWFRGAQNPPPHEMVQSIKRDFLSQLQDIKNLAAGKIVDRIEEFEPRDLTGLLKISAELAQLLSGQPTAINEERGAGARDKLSDLVNRRIAAGRDSGDTEYIQ